MLGEGREEDVVGAVAGQDRHAEVGRTVPQLLRPAEQRGRHDLRAGDTFGEMFEGGDDDRGIVLAVDEDDEPHATHLGAA